MLIRLIILLAGGYYMDELPKVGYLRLKQILGHPQAKPPIMPLISVAKATWWRGVKTGRFPQPIKIGKRITVWKAEDIYNFLKKDGGCD